ncbi:S41 family peptidase [Oleiagrimonas soli]|uniref:Carboxyl-terminal processing protease n=1 Tax=Oleiagrimonas soli TaxID=1543381 RepID=A0A099D0Z3_9GAMM|nr:S41 family peptidase [Oleiagrimonas soli]KGI78955.1 peptidase S41 [Oleiagrimonas soli]MBB6184533.1 carboxyl-terminal processing protease [Oleiagrimonas soli]
MRHAMLLLVLLPALAWSGPMRAAQTPASATSAPAPAASTAAQDDSVDLRDIRNFTRAYEIIRQAYVEKVSNRELMDKAISGMLAGLDPHSAYLDRQGLDTLDEDTSGRYGGLGVEVAQVNGELMVVAPLDGSPAARAGIKPGDVILKVDQAPVDPDDVDASIAKLRGEPGTKITLTVVHEKSSVPTDIAMTRERIALTSVNVRELEPGYAYIRISQFQADTVDDLQSKFAALEKKHGPQKGAVLDLRSNPGGLVTAAVGVSNAFLDSGRIVSTRGRLADANMSFDATPGDILHGAPLILLVDNGTASAAEIVAGALQDNRRALVMGRRTFGKGVVQTVIPVDENHAIKLTTARYYTPSGRSIQAEGITPDIRIADLVARAGDHGPSLIGSEADLPNHLANEAPDTTRPTPIKPDDDGALARSDYALAQALNVLKGLALSRKNAAATAH